MDKTGNYCGKITQSSGKTGKCDGKITLPFGKTREYDGKMVLEDCSSIQQT